MKLFSILLPAAASLLLMGCNSLDNPITNLFHTGHDERVYNPQTGQWEWPPDKRQKKTATAANTAPPQGFNDTRYWDPQRNQWAEQDQPRTSTPPKTKPAASNEEAVSAPAPTVPPPPPAPPRAAQATGVYNASTGRIEWQTSDAHVPRGATAPEPKKHWYWPF